MVFEKCNLIRSITRYQINFWFKFSSLSYNLATEQLALLNKRIYKLDEKEKFK